MQPPPPFPRSLPDDRRRAGIRSVYRLPHTPQMSTHTPPLSLNRNTLRTPQHPSYLCTSRRKPELAGEGGNDRKPPLRSCSFLSLDTLELPLV
ncbi:hypothetical protein Hdeb2414_s0004g00144631 [Helianthus debilis subsp. tardiflorus]